MADNVKRRGSNKEIQRHSALSTYRTLGRKTLGELMTFLGRTLISIESLVALARAPPSVPFVFLREFFALLLIGTAVTTDAR